MKTVTVAAFNSISEAESLKMRLIAAGIQAEIHNETGLDETLEFSRVRAGVQIEVPRADFEAALQLVYAWNAATEAEMALARTRNPTTYGPPPHRAENNVLPSS